MNSPDLKTVQDETLRKVGRNVLYFQRMEAMLKYLISRSSLQGTTKTLKTNHDKNVAAVSNQTLGNLVKGLFDSVYSDPANAAPSDEMIEKGSFSFSIKIQNDQASIDAQRDELSRIVQERNDLIHKQLVKLDTESIQSCQELGVILDEQLERLKPWYSFLQTVGLSLQAYGKELLAGREQEK